jgi:AbrB family looped-hinge helix DNA binding protein
MPVATLTSKGQVTIPAAVRERLGIKTGDRVDFAFNAAGTVTLSPKRLRFEEVAGVLRRPAGTPVSVRQMDEGAARVAKERWRRSNRRAGR